MNFPQQNRKMTIKQVAEKHNISFDTAFKYLKELGITKTREQYTQDAQERRRIVFELRQQGKKFREIGELLGISTNNAQQLARRFEGKP